MEKTVNIQNHADICAEGKLNSRHCKPVICIETGEVFTSVADAANAIGCHAPDLSSHLTGKKRSIKGRHFCYLSRATESLDAIVSRLREASTMEEDARKWRAQEAEKEAARVEEEKRLAKIAKAKEKIEHRKRICKQLESRLLAAEKNLMDAERELEDLVGAEEADEILKRESAA